MGSEDILACPHSFEGLFQGSDLVSCFWLLQEVLRNLVKRYVAAMIRDAKTEEGLTEENFKVCSCNPANNEDCKLLQFMTKHLL